MPAPMDPILNQGWETILYATPCILLGIAAVFRLDMLFLSPRSRSGKVRVFPGNDENGQPVLRDPDGRPF
jgi:hypothetical protein